MIDYQFITFFEMLYKKLFYVQHSTSLYVF